MEHFMKSPCKHCPFRHDVTPFLHPDRAEELAYSTQNKYSSFPCHKTTVSNDDFGGDGSEMMIVDESKECAGFLTLRAQTGEDIPDGFKPSWELCYTDPYDMSEAYQQQWDKSNKMETGGDAK